VRFLAVPAIKSTMSFVEIATHLGLGFIEEVYSAAMGFFSGFHRTGFAIKAVIIEERVISPKSEGAGG
jgi:hypothetical protein